MPLGAIQESLVEICEADYVMVPVAAEEEETYRSAGDLARAIARREIREAAQAFGARPTSAIGCSISKRWS